MKKKLPKALLWTADDMRVAGSASPQQPESMQPPDLSERKSGTPTGAPAGEIIELPRLPDPRPAVIANANLQPTATPADQYWARRRRLRATTIVERHANFSAVGGFIPVPIANVAAVTAMIVRMVRSLSDLYGVPFEHDRARTIVIGLMGGLVPTGLAAVTTSTLLYVVPASNLLGLAVSSITAAACTRNIGRIFVEHFENGATLAQFPADGSAPTLLS
jgi:uncharacterized protein (DUF697 family)